MKFAIVDGTKTEATKGAKGICPYCGSELIAKCGDFKLNHWAHKGIINCDPWGENETEWHRAWKGNFATNWQEIILADEITGEKHRADVCTVHGLVIEFQHSHLDPQERTKREDFYKNMIWVIDGTRLKYDYPRFLKGKNDFRLVKKGIFRVDFPEEYFPAAWLDRTVPVIFDFQGNETISDPSDMRNGLYCLFPVRIGASAIITEIPRNTFINKVKSGEWLIRTKHFLNELNQVKQEQLDHIEKQQRQRTNMIFEKFGRANQYRKRRL